MAEKTKLFDVAIVGYGPAGITAGIYAARRHLKTVLIGQIPGGEVVNSGEIENWPGDGVTTGIELAGKLEKHLKSHRDLVDIVGQKIVSGIVKDDDNLFTLTCDDGAAYRAQTVIYAAGRHPRELNVPGEQEFRAKGVSYCATCDAPLFSYKTVAVIGGGNTGAEAVIMLLKIARKIYLLHINDRLTADPILVDNFKNETKVKIIYNARATKIAGDGVVSSLSYEDGETGEEKTLEVSGIFVSIGAIPNTDPVKDLIKLDKYGAIPADRYGQTRLDGFFAAGDVTDVRDAQIVVAAGQGCSAALSVGYCLARK